MICCDRCIIFPVTYVASSLLIHSAQRGWHVQVELVLCYGLRSKQQAPGFLKVCLCCCNRTQRTWFDLIPWESAKRDSHSQRVTSVTLCIAWIFEHMSGDSKLLILLSGTKNRLVTRLSCSYSGLWSKQLLDHCRTATGVWERVCCCHTYLPMRRFSWIYT